MQNMIILNLFISPFEEEIRRVVKKLKNNKSCGPDFVLNEFIESTLDVFLPIYKTFQSHSRH